MNLLVFLLQDNLFGLDITFVERVILAVEYIHLSDPKEGVLGAINFHGELVPLIDLRKLFGFENKEIDLNDHYLICQIENKKIALWIDKIKQVLTNEGKVLKSNSIQSQEWIESFIEKDNEVIPILNVRKLADEVQVLHR